ncbi:MAG: hypothetical protein ABL866_00815 [Devosia sp.]
MQVDVCPGYGARIGSLIDLRTGREWISGGQRSPETGAGAAYLADEARGWDECFPTVEPWDATGTGWARPLRDHGELWGRPWTVLDHDRGSLSVRFETEQFAFVRRLHLVGQRLACHYEARNKSPLALPFVWAQHALLAVTPSDRIVLPEVGTLASPYISKQEVELRPGNVPWPGSSQEVGLALDRVQPASAGFAGKFFAAARGIAAIGDQKGSLQFTWDKNVLPFLGVWLNYGGWPQPGDIHHVALEPTTSPTDSLGDALAAGTSRQLRPGQSESWTVELRLRPTIDG